MYVWTFFLSFHHINTTVTHLYTYFPKEKLSKKTESENQQYSGHEEFSKVSLTADFAIKYIQYWQRVLVKRFMHFNLKLFLMNYVSFIGGFFVYL